MSLNKLELAIDPKLVKKSFIVGTGERDQQCPYWLILASPSIMRPKTDAEVAFIWSVEPVCILNKGSGFSF